MLNTAGARTFELHDPELNVPFAVMVLYPATVPESPQTFGPYTVEVALDAPVDSTAPRPLVVISHGSGGSHLVYRTLAMHLARNGFVVVMPEHPRNNRHTNDLAGTAANLAHRPAHLRRVMDWAFAHAEFGPVLHPDTVAVIGHSIGGYTALAIAGGRPTSHPWESPDNRKQPVPVTPDLRVKALVLLAPAAAWFLEPGALEQVHAPVLMLTAGQDDLEVPGPKQLPDGSVVDAPYGHSEVIKRGLPASTRVEHLVEPDAGHYSFLSPFPPSMARPAFPPSQDPPGFDRIDFLSRMNEHVLTFLRSVLMDAV